MLQEPLTSKENVDCLESVEQRRCSISRMRIHAAGVRTEAFSFLAKSVRSIECIFVTINAAPKKQVQAPLVVSGVLLDASIRVPLPLRERVEHSNYVS